MERPLTLKPLSIQDENSVIHRKKVGADGISKTSGPLAKKSGVVRESRKALNDITNKSSIRPETTSKSKKSGKKQSKVVENGYSNQQVLECEALSKKKISVHEKLNIAEEGFLHDHSKCIDAQKAAAASQLNFWDTVLPGHAGGNVLASLVVHPELKQYRSINSAHSLIFLGFCHVGDDYEDSTDLIMERPKGDPDNCYLKLEELSMLEFSDWFKPQWMSPPPSPLHQDSPSAWEFEAVELLLKEDDYHVRRDVSL